MSFHPNDVMRRGRLADYLLLATFVFLVGAFFRTQILRHEQWTLQSEENRLREVPIPAPRGIIYDRRGQPIAENVVGYSVSVLSASEDSLRATLQRLRGTIDLSNHDVEEVIRRYRRDRTRPTVIIPDASFDVVSVLEEHRIDFPSLIIQSSPKRVYPDSNAVGAFVGYVGEINENELSALSNSGYKPGQQIGKQGLEKEYEERLRGHEGVQFVEVDARNRVVQIGGARENIPPEAGKPLQTNIDLDLQRYIEQLFGDTLVGAAVAMVPRTGEVLAIYSAPSIDPNRFVGGVSAAYYDSLRNDPRHPLYNKALQGQYPPGSTFKLATSVIALENNLINFNTHMPEPCTGYFYYGNRVWHCWKKQGHGSLNLTNAIAQSCDVYFYQLGLKVGLARLIAGGVALNFNKKTGIDLPEENRPIFPTSQQYFNDKYGPRGWTPGSVELNMAIGQGDNAQTVVDMARFYSALAAGGNEPVPTVGRSAPRVIHAISLSQGQMDSLRTALTNVVSSGTAAAAALRGVMVAGKTGTAQTGYFSKTGKPLYDAWFAGFAPADDPQIVVVVMMEHATFEGATSAGVATKIIGHYLHVNPVNAVQTQG